MEVYEQHLIPIYFPLILFSKDAISLNTSSTSVLNIDNKNVLFENQIKIL